jgi:NADH-quinone oxidoreductase subunit E
MSFPDALEGEIEAIRARAEDPSEALVPMLRAAQGALGWLSDETLGELAARAGVSVEDAANIAAYFDFRRAPPAARFLVEVCVNINCRRRGGAALLERASALLGLEVGAGSPDGRLALQEIVCLKHCESGPALRLDGVIHDELTPERVDALLGPLRGPAG